MKRSGFKRRSKPINKASAKRKAYRASAEGQIATAHMLAVKSLPCVICGTTPCDAHHVIHDRYGARKASDFDTIPLCPSHHRYPYPDAIHTDKAAWRQRYGPDWGYLEYVRKLTSGAN